MTSTELWPLFEQPSPKPWAPHNYQKKAVKFGLEHAAAAFFLDPGLGKTAIMLAIIKMLKKLGLFEPVLLIAPLRVCYSVWRQEAQKWTDFHGLKLELLHGPDKDAALKRSADIYLINPEGLDWLTQAERVKTTSKSGRVTAAVKIDMARWRKLGFGILVIDELTKFKNHQSGRFKLMKQLLPTFGRRYGLTGSPAANGLLDLFGQVFMLDQGRSLGQYITHYRLKYFHPVDKAGFVWVPRAGAEEEIYERLVPLALRMAAEDYLDMPKVITTNILLDLPDEARRFYDAMEDQLLAAIQNRVVTAANAGVAAGKCHQIANGGIYLTPDLKPSLLKLPKQKREWLHLHYEKIEALLELIEELQGQPLLVAYHHEHDLDRLRERLGKDIPVIGGGVSPKQSDLLIRAWQAGKLPYLFMHPQSAAHGLDGLQTIGRHVAWLSMTYDYELYDQFIRRLRRQGSHAKQIFVYHIMARGTVDQVMLASLSSKDRGQQAFFKGLLALAKHRK